MQIFRTLRGTLFVALALLSLSACVPTGRPIAGARGDTADPFAGGSRAEPQDVEIRVTNLNFNDARLYARSSGGGRRLIGEVRAKSDKVFWIPWRFTQRLRIEIDLVASSSCITREFQVDPGEILGLDIQSTLERGGYCR